jgi:two-component system response regulator AtoC
MARLIICDDDPAVLLTLDQALASRGHQITTFTRGEDALAAMSSADSPARADKVDVVLTDLSMPGVDGLELLAATRALDAALPVILITARGSEKIAVQAMKSGAFDYIPKPFAIDEVRLVVARAAEMRELRRSAHRASIERALGQSIVGESEVFRALLDETVKVARRDVTVLVRGETGTGKELIAGALHAGSARRDRACVRFNCAAIPSDLADAELFGHARGAFTGANQARRGYFAQADGGTLVLDEVGELPLSIQAKLLRVLQEGEIQPVGSGRIEKVDVRVVSCTNRDLLDEVAAGRFREDLYYRLAVFEIVIPPLRERPDDVPALLSEFVRRYARRFGLDDISLSADLIRVLSSRPWPGNAREIENTVARLLALSEGGEIGLDALAHLERRVSKRVTSASSPHDPEPVEPSTSSTTIASDGDGLRARMATFERDIIEQALKGSRGNNSEAARQLGITRVTLLDKMKRYGLGGYAPRHDD